MLYSLRKYESSEVGKEKMKIIKFYEEYGEKATKEAFGADRKLISKWKGLLNKYGLRGLIPVSTRPHNLRRSEIPTEIINHIKALRTSIYAHLSPTTLKTRLISSIFG